MRSLLLALPALFFLAPDVQAQARAAYTFRNVQTNECLTALGETSSFVWRNEPVRLMPCDATLPRTQLWHLEEVDGYDYYTYRVVSAAGGRVLDIHPSTRRATTYPALPWYQSNQVYDMTGWAQWTLESHQGGCLDAYYLAYRYGPEVGTWNCHRGNNQQWMVHWAAEI